MKLSLRKLHTLALSSAALGVVLCASAQAGGWYVGLGGGFSLPSDVAVPGKIAIGNSLIGGATVKLDTAFRGAASAGYRWQQLRFEGEIGFSDATINALSVGGVSAPVSGASLSNVTLFGNLVYDLPVAKDLSLNLGGGLGLGIASLDTGTAKNDDSGFAFQTITGLTYHWSKNLDLAFDYRYVRTSGLHYGGGSSDLGSHNLMLSVRWFFDPAAAPSTTPVAVAKPRADATPVEDAKPVVAAQAVVEPAPAAQAKPVVEPKPVVDAKVVAQAKPVTPPPSSPSQIKTYIVFFDFNKSYLTDAAQSVVAEAIKVAKTTGMVKIQIAGYIDTVGANDNTMRLSLARAATVKDEMIRLGWDGTAIAFEGKGFNNPLVTTAVNDRVPQSRRAVIDLGS